MIEIPRWLDMALAFSLGILQAVPASYFAVHNNWLGLGICYFMASFQTLMIRRFRSR